jgi:hypothetical protein
VNARAAVMRGEVPHGAPHHTAPPAALAACTGVALACCGTLTTTAPPDSGHSGFEGSGQQTQKKNAGARAPGAGAPIAGSPL